MGLLLHQWDPTAAARVLQQAMQQGQAQQAQQAQQAIELAKSVSDARRHALEFDRTLAFNQARDAENQDAKLRDDTESRRRYDLENAPFQNPLGQPVANPAAALPVDSGAPTDAPITQEIGSEGVNPAAMLPGAPVDELAGEAAKIEAENIQKQRDALQTRAGRTATRSIPLREPDLPTAPGGSNTALIDGAKSQLAQLGDVLAQTGVPAKKAKEILGTAARNILAPGGRAAAATAPKVKTSYVDPETGTVHTQFTSGAWDTPPEDPTRLRPLGKAPAEEKGTRFVNADTGEQYVMKPNGQMIDADGEPVNPENAQRLQKVGSQSAAREQLAETKQKTAVEQKAAEVKAKAEKATAAAKAKLVEQERGNLRTYRQQRKGLKTNEKGELVGDAIENAKAIDAQISASEERLSAMGAKEEETPASTDAAPAAKGATVWREDANGIKWEYDAETKKATGSYLRPSSKSP